MIDKNGRVKLSFACEMDDNTAWDIEQKGWCEIADAHLPDGSVVRLSFWDPSRLAQSLEDELKSGKTCFTEPAMIVVPTVSIENMKTAVEELYESGYFDQLRALFQPDCASDI